MFCFDRAPTLLFCYVSCLGSGDVRVFEVRVRAQAPGDLLESVEFVSVGFTAVLTVRASIVAKGSSSVAPHLDTRVVDE